MKQGIVNTETYGNHGGLVGRAFSDGRWFEPRSGQIKKLVPVFMVSDHHLRARAEPVGKMSI